MSFWGPNGLFLGSGYGLQTVLGSTHAVDEFSFSMISLILIFEFDLIFRSFLTFWCPDGLFFGLG